MLLLAAIMLTGCLSLDDWDDPDEDAEYTQYTEYAEAAFTNACESHEVEVEPGICSYIVECDDVAACEIWGALMLGSMEEWYGDLLFAEEWDIDEKESEKDPDGLAEFRVAGNHIVLDPSSEEEEYYAWLWNRFAWIIPADQRQIVSRFEVYEHADTMAYVIQDEEDYEAWTYAANYMQATYETERILTDIHEFGHLLSLNAEQVDPYVDESECPTYMLDEGCAEEHSYIYDFYQRFWADGESDDENDYVTEYAMSDLYEDFAESWTYFVMTARPAGSAVTDRKISFFYDYEELIMLKAQILGRAASWLERNVDYE